MVKRFSLITLFFITVSFSFAQENKFSIQLSNPLGMFQKSGLKVEYRIKKTSFLLSAIQYYGFTPKYPGTQLNFECRKYLETKSEKEFENFFYLKAIGGHQNYFGGSGSGFTRIKEIPEGNYGGFGGGIGRRFLINRIFIDLNIGLKYIKSEVTQSSLFYTLGPASFVDFQVYVGLPF